MHVVDADTPGWLALFLVALAALAFGEMQFLAMATTVIATATTTIVARCGCCGGTGGGSGGSGRSRRSCGSRCWARLVGIELRHLGCATDVFGSTITRLPTLPRLAVQRIFFQSALEIGRAHV